MAPRSREPGIFQREPEASEKKGTGSPTLIETLTYIHMENLYLLSTKVLKLIKSFRLINFIRNKE